MHRTYLNADHTELLDLKPTKGNSDFVLYELITVTSPFYMTAIQRIKKNNDILLTHIKYFKSLTEAEKDFNHRGRPKGGKK